jgi:hypothetical protein
VSPAVERKGFGQGDRVGDGFGHLTAGQGVPTDSVTMAGNRMVSLHPPERNCRHGWDEKSSFPADVPLGKESLMVDYGDVMFLQFVLKTLGWLVLGVGAIAVFVMTGAGLVVVLDAWRSAPLRRSVARR